MKINDIFNFELDEDKKIQKVKTILNYKINRKKEKLNKYQEEMIYIKNIRKEKNEKYANNKNNISRKENKKKLLIKVF